MRTCFITNTIVAVDRIPGPTACTAAARMLATYPGRVTLDDHYPIDTTGMSGADAKAFGERVREIIKPDAESDVTQLATR